MKYSQVHAIGFLVGVHATLVAVLAPGIAHPHGTLDGVHIESGGINASSHDHASADAIWLVKRYQPESYFVQFYKVEPEDKVGIVTVQCFEEAETLTRVQVSYEYIALAEKGRKFIDAFTQNAYEEFISEWEELLVKYYESQK